MTQQTHCDYCADVCMDAVHGTGQALASSVIVLEFVRQSLIRLG